MLNVSKLAVCATLAACAMWDPTPASASVVFTLSATDIVVDTPAPLFTSPSITGTITLADTVGPGVSFGASSVLGVTLDILGISGTLADVAAEIAPGPVQIFGTRSADGRTLSVLDFRYGFPTTTPGCSFACAGQIIINSSLGPNDPSNFIAIDDLNGDTLSVLERFTPSFTTPIATPVPEPGALALLATGLAVAAVARRNRPA